MLYLNEINIFYERTEAGDKPVLLLHGWGGSGKTMKNIYMRLSALGKKVILPDLMGFGSSMPPKPSMDIYDYADSVQAILKEENIEKCDVIGHSFGGRIALILAARGIVDNLILISSAGMKPKFSLKKYIKIKKYKIAKRKGKEPKNSGSSDYRMLDEGMKSVFVRVVNEHLEYLLPSITCPTLIMWGENDDQTPKYMAKRLNEGIKDSGIVYLCGGHFAYLEDAYRALKIMEAFLCQQ